MMLSYPDAVVCVRKEREAPVSLHAPELCFDYIGAMREDTIVVNLAPRILALKEYFQRLFFASWQARNTINTISEKAAPPVAPAYYVAESSFFHSG